MRVGIGHDTHRLVPGRPLWIGGVEIESDLGAVGHSDADVLLHAITDALLGSASLGDIGQWFPDTDPEFQDADSSQFVLAARDALRERGLGIVNLDLIVFAERPRLSPLSVKIRERLAELLEIPIGQVNLKAKTGEGVGPVGRREAIQAMAVVLVDDVTTDEAS
tara:strand:+ start:43 stop:534 length:492 start_codon:yes stop_codon:yes gene_type:complete